MAATATLEHPALRSRTDPLAGARLLQVGGVEVVPRLFSEAMIMALFDEAVRSFPAATEEVRETPDDEDWRGGLPPRRLLTGQGGPAQDHVYQSPSVLLMLQELIGVPLRPSSSRATYSYYCRPGDHLGLHRDVDRCDISVIIVLSDNSQGQPGGELVVYPDAIGRPLGDVRAAPHLGARALKPAAGETVVIAGGHVPHLVRPMEPGQYRISSPMCFEVPAR